MEHSLTRLQTLLFLLFLSSSASLAQQKIVYKSPQIAEDENESRSKRYEYELMRFRDPATGNIPENIRSKELKYASKMASLSQKNASILSQEVTWVNRGPANVGGRTRALGIDLDNEHIFLAGGTSGGMYRSVDQGNTWIRTTPLSNMPSVSCLAQDRRKGKRNVWYYGTGELGGNTAAYPLWLNYGVSSWGDYYGNGIYKSTDDGLTWNVLSSTTYDTAGYFVQPFNFVNSIVTDSSNHTQDVVYAAVAGGIERSSDGGATWSLVLGDPKTGSAFTSVAVTSKGVVYAVLGSISLAFGSYGYWGNSTDGGVYRSTDGIHWTNITPDAWQNNSYYVSIAVAPSNENVAYLAFDSSGYSLTTHVLWKYTYLSGDGSGSGGIFENRSANLAPSDQNFFVYYVNVKPDDENTVYVGGLYLLRSTNGFKDTLKNVNLNIANGYYDLHVDENSLAFFPSHPSSMIIGNDGGVFMTNDNLSDNVTWTTLDNSYLTAQFYTVAIDHGSPGDSTIVGGMQDNSTQFTNSTDPSVSWVFLLGGDGSACAIADGRSSYYVSLQNGQTYREIIDDQGNMSDYGRIDPSGGTNYPFYNVFRLDPVNSNVMYFGGGNVLWRNTNLLSIPLESDNTTTIGWTRLSKTVVNTISTKVYQSQISAIAVSKIPSERVYYGTNDGQLFRIDSANTGNPIPKNIWKSKGFPSSAYISSIAVDPHNADNVFLAFANYNVQSLFHSTDGGSSWTAVGGNLEEYPNGSGNGPSCRSVAILHSGTGIIYLVGTSTGLYSSSTLNGTSTVWNLEGKNTIGNNIVNAIDTRESDGLVAVATCGNGVFTGQFAPASGVSDNNSPSSSSIQLFPNPNKGIINIHKTISEPVNVSIVNILGEKIIEMNAPISTSDFTIDLNNQPQGMYFVHLKTDTTDIIKKIVKE